MQAEWGNLNVLELRLGALCQTRTRRDRKPDFNRTGDANGYIAALVMGRAFRGGYTWHVRITGSRHLGHKHLNPVEPALKKHPLFRVALRQFAVEREALAGQPLGQRPRGLAL